MIILTDSFVPQRLTLNTKISDFLLSVAATLIMLKNLCLFYRVKAVVFLFPHLLLTLANMLK